MLYALGLACCLMLVLVAVFGFFLLLSWFCFRMAEKIDPEGGALNFIVSMMPLFMSMFLIALGWGIAVAYDKNWHPPLVKETPVPWIAWRYL